MNKTIRIIDANCNRAKEGLRVCEDIIRFIMGDEKLTMQLKDTRHCITSVLKSLGIKEQDLVDSRSTGEDVGKKSSVDEINKNDIRQVLSANLQRVKESIRVLEEVSKIINKDKSQKFKDLRYKVYDIEKAIFKKVSTLSNNE